MMGCVEALGIERGRPPCVMSFAGSDPTGGAGIQADLLTLAAFGCHPLSVITALTVQNSVGVRQVLPVDAAWVYDQAREVLEETRVDAFKLGMLGDPATIEVIAKILADYPRVPVVLDPVLASGRGDPLINQATIEAMIALLLPKTTLITPNSIEARRLASVILGAPPQSLREAAQALLTAGAEYVLLTGGHEETHAVINTLYDTRGILREDRWERLPHGYHGSGCTLASSVAAGFAWGKPIEATVVDAQSYTWKTLFHAYALGRGQKTPDRFFAMRAAGADVDGG